MKIMECPISLEKIVIPRILPCGHTFDEKSLSNVHSCPLCRQEFHYHTLDDLPINWILMSLDQKMFYNMICETTFKKEQKIFYYNLQCIKLKIMSASQKGHFCIVIKRNNIKAPSSIKESILRSITVKLRTIGFIVCEGYEIFCWTQIPRILISWKILHL